MTSQTPADNSVDPRLRRRALALLVVSPLFFSSNLIIGRAAAQTVEPSTLAFWRWLIAFMILLPFAFSGLRKHRATLLAHAGELVVLGFLGMTLCGSLIYVALKSTTATNATLIYTSSPVLIVLLEWLFRGIRPGARQMLGIALAFAGVATILMKGDIDRLIHFRFNPGDIGVAVGALAWAVYSVILRRKHFTSLPTIVLFCAIAGTGAAILAPFMAYEAIRLDAFPRTQEAWMSILGVAVFASVLAFSTFQYGVKTVGPSIAGVFMYLLPVYGVSLAVLFLGERVQAFHLAGFAGVATGVALTTLPKGLFRRRT
ncbi:MAG: EamA family transporter [Rhodobiaceae bacterium]|nr:EamA family transporter [Rhodobiaceae bacterium]MCC0052953.1 EamA family transporter [Rhodobiaceae bacterium]